MNKLCVSLSPGVIKLMVKKELAKKQTGGDNTLPVFSFQDVLAVLKTLPIKDWSYKEAKDSLNKALKDLRTEKLVTPSFDSDTLIKQLNLINESKDLNVKKSPVSLFELNNLDTDGEESAFKNESVPLNFTPTEDREVAEWSKKFFGNSIFLQSKTLRMFISKRVIMPALVGDSTELPASQNYDPKTGLNNNIKESKIKLLQNLAVSTKVLTSEEYNAVMNLTSSDDNLKKEAYEYLKVNELNILNTLKEAVLNPGNINLSLNLLEKTSLQYKNLDTETKTYIDNYLDLVQYVSFDFLLGIQAKDILTTNENAFYDLDTIKYDYERGDKKSAKIWNTKEVTDHAETQAPVVKLLLNNTPLYSYNTKSILEDQYLDAFSASRAWISARAYYNATDPNGVIKAIKTALNDKNISLEEKNILYTLFETYFNSDNPVSLISKSTISNSDLLNVLINNFRTQVEMNFSEVQEKGEGNFTLVNLNQQTSGGTIFQVKTALVNAFDIMANGDMPIREKLDLKTVNSKTVIDEINTLLGTYGLNKVGIIGKSQSEIMAEVYNLSNLISFYENLFELYNSIAETKLSLELSPNSQTKDSILKLQNGIYKTNLPLTSSNFAAISNILGNLKTQAEGVKRKVTIRNSHDTTNASVGNSNLINQLKDQFNRIRRYTNAINNNFKLFEKNPLINDSDAFKGIIFRGDISASGKNPMLNAKASIAESMTYNILNFYAEQLANNEDPYFDFTNFSDKTLNGAIRINKKYFTKQGNRTQTPQAILEEKKKAFIEMQKDYLNKSAIRILNNYQRILDILHDLALIPKQNIEITDDLGQSLINLNEKLASIFNKKAEFIYKGKSLKFDEVLNLAASKAGIKLINYVDYNDKIIQIKDTLIKDIIIFNNSDKVNAFLDAQFLDFKTGLNLNKVNLTASPTMIETIKKATDKIFGSNTLKFPTVSSNKKIISGNIPSEFIQAYFYDWLLASNSAMNATAGHSINQKAGYLVNTMSTEELTNFNKNGVDSKFNAEVQNHLKNLSTLWQAQTKRNVIFTASMLNYNINTDKGLKGGANVSFVRDLESELKPIGVGTQGVTDWDGASIGLMHHMIRLYRSLGGKFSSDGGIDQKSFINFLDPLTGSSTLIKHALFAMTPGVVKASLGNDMSILNLYENIYRKHKVEGVNLLQNLSSTQNDLSNPKNLYYYEDFTGDNVEGAIKKIDSWEFKGNDTYAINETNLTTGETSQRIVEIKNMWDFITAFKAFNTLIPSQSKTNFSSLDLVNKDTKYFTPSFGAFELLVDIEDANIDSGLYKLYNLPNNKLATEILSESINTGLINSQEHVNKMKQGFNDFIVMINQGNPTILLEALEKVKGTTNNENIEYFIEQVLNQKDTLETRSYQPLKGVMTDMITTYGGAKVGQNNMNSLQTLLGLEQDPGLQIEGVNTLYHQLINYENGGLQVDTAHDPHHAELSIPKQMLAALNFGMLEGERAQELNQIFSSLVLESIQEDLDLSNYLSSSSEVINSIVNRIIKSPGVVEHFNDLLNNTTPEELIRTADLFNEGVKEINKFISPKELNIIITQFKARGLKEFDLSVFKDTANYAITSNRVNETVANNVSKKFTDLLTTTEDIENASMADLILESFKDELPIDHSTLLKDAVSALAASFSNKAARLKFDGLLAVIQPASKMIQVVEIQGTPEGVKLYSRSGNKISTRILKEGETATLIGEQVDIQAKYSKVNPVDLYSQKRELKGPELLGSLINTSTGERSTFIGSVLDVDYNEDGSIKGENSQLATSLAIDGLEEIVKNYMEGIYKMPTNSYTLGLINYWAKELGLPQIKTAAGIKNLIKTIQIKELGLIIQPKEKYEEAVKAFNAKGDNIQVRTQRALGDRAKKSINDDIESILQTGKPVISAYISPEFWQDKIVEGLKVTPGEIVAPMLFADQFLLREGDDYNNISEEFFYERLLEKNYVEGNYKKVLISNTTEPVLLYTNEDDFKAEVQSLPKLPLNKEGTHLIDSTGKEILEIPVGVSPEIYRRPDNSLVIFITGLNKAGEKTNSYEIMANLKGLFNKTFKAGYKLRNNATKTEISERITLEAKKMWEAFKLFNEVTGARIPGQHYQSFQYLKVVGWINDKQSAVWVPRATTLFAGSDW